jgi:signal transduction histidine kinase
MNTTASDSKTRPRIRFSIRIKLFLVILVPALILVLVILLDYSNLSTLGLSAERILSQNYKSIKAAQEIRNIVETTRDQLLLDIFAYQATDPKAASSTRQIVDLLNVCQNNITESGEETILKGVSGYYDEYQALLNSLILNKDKPLTLDERFQKFVSLSAKFITELNELVLINERAMEHAERETRRVADRALHYSIGLLIAAILFTLIVSYLLSGKISKPITKLAQILSKVKEGSGSYPEVTTDSRDEIGFLVSEFNQLFARLKAYDQVSADKLLAEKEKVHQSELAKAKFIADLSHQLKTPMTSLAMSVGLLDEKASDLESGKQRRLLETAREDCHRLSSLINELVDIARLESMVTPREKEVLDIEVVVTECIKPLKQQAEEKGVHLHVDIEKGVPPVAIDSLRFPWVITNLTGNALRHTSAGGRVALTVRHRDHRLYIQCQDNGTGIDARFVPRIFDRYSQFSERGRNGTIGLGLAIVKEIVEDHGGRIGVESELGKGTTFTLWIPTGIGE